MLKHVLKLQDSATGEFWNGNSYWPKFNNTGHQWTKQAFLERDLICYLADLKKINPVAELPSTLQIVKYELETTSKVTGANPLSDLMSAIVLKSELQKINWRYVSFYNEMAARGVIDEIIFIMKLRAAPGLRFVSMEQTLECRAQLRLLGVKTRTFREFSGMFGMMNREQAMRARLTLDLESSVDLAELRQTIAAKNQTIAFEEAAKSIKIRIGG